MTASCRICGRPYQRPLVGPADYRCPACQAAHRYWSPAQLGTRAHVYVRIRWWEIDPDTGRRERKKSPLDGLAGIGTRVDRPEDGWQVRLLESPERSLYFGAGSIEVDWEIRSAREPERSVFSLAPARIDASGPRAGAEAAAAPRTGKVSSGDNGGVAGLRTQKRAETERVHPNLSSARLS